GRIVWLHAWASAWIGFEMDGSLVVRCGCPDVGGGQASSLCQIAAEVLGVPLTRISVHVSDSALTPLAGTTTASRQLYMSGNAVLKTARELRAPLLRVAATLLGGDADELDMDEGNVTTPDGRTLPIARLLAECARVGVPRSHLGVYHAPAVRAVVVESGEGLGPFNARGIGEPPIGPPAAAIANAIEDATGARLTRLPITAERVARGLGLLEDAS